MHVLGSQFPTNGATKVQTGLTDHSFGLLSRSEQGDIVSPPEARARYLSALANLPHDAPIVQEAAQPSQMLVDQPSPYIPQSTAVTITPSHTVIVSEAVSTSLSFLELLHDFPTSSAPTAKRQRTDDTGPSASHDFNIPVFTAPASESTTPPTIPHATSDVGASSSPTMESRISALEQQMISMIEMQKTTLSTVQNLQLHVAQAHTEIANKVISKMKRQSAKSIRRIQKSATEVYTTAMQRLSDRSMDVIKEQLSTAGEKMVETVVEIIKETFDIHPPPVIYTSDAATQTDVQEDVAARADADDIHVTVNASDFQHRTELTDAEIEQLMTGPFTSASTPSHIADESKKGESSDSKGKGILSEEDVQEGDHDMIDLDDSDDDFNVMDLIPEPEEDILNDIAKFDGMAKAAVYDEFSVDWTSSEEEQEIQEIVQTDIEKQIADDAILAAALAQELDTYPVDVAGSSKSADVVSSSQSDMQHVSEQQETSDFQSKKNLEAAKAKMRQLKKPKVITGNENDEEVEALRIKILGQLKNINVSADYLKSRKSEEIFDMYKNMMYQRERRKLEDEIRCLERAVEQEEKSEEIELRKKEFKSGNLILARDTEYSRKFKSFARSYQKGVRDSRSKKISRASARYADDKRQRQKEIIRGKFSSKFQPISLPGRGRRRVELWWYDKKQKCCFLRRLDGSLLKFTFDQIPSALEEEDLEELFDAEFINEHNELAGKMCQNRVRLAYRNSIAVRFGVSVKEEPIEFE